MKERKKKKKNLHRVTDERGILQLVLLYERSHVLGHGSVVMAGIVGRVAVVAKVLHMLK